MNMEGFLMQIRPKLLNIFMTRVPNFKAHTKKNRMSFDMFTNLMKVFG